MLVSNGAPQNIFGLGPRKAIIRPWRQTLTLVIVGLGLSITMFHCHSLVRFYTFHWVNWIRIWEVLMNTQLKSWITMHKYDTIRYKSLTWTRKLSVHTATYYLHFA